VVTARALREGHVETRKLLLGTITAFLAATPVHGATIKAADSTVAFDFEEKIDANGITCNLITMIVDPTRPEVVNLRIIEALSTVNPRAIFLAYSLDVGDIRYDNGMPAGLTWTTLNQGDISSGSFSTVGSFYGGVANGGVLKSTVDQATATAMWDGLRSGSFSIQFQRASTGAPQNTYIITKPISRDALARYLACRAQIYSRALGRGELERETYGRISRGGPGITEDQRTDNGTIIPALVHEHPLVGAF
jgi:hypothetical protein